jgi:exodeoxyribonuclease V alpha subunit
VPRLTEVFRQAAETRGKRLVVLVGQRKALAIALRTHGSKRRWRKLREWLQSALTGAQGRLNRAIFAF